MSTHRLSRHLVYGRRGMICSNSPVAAGAGLKVLQDGGNAFDAALAVAAVETVTLVPMCGLGGDSFVLLHDAATGRSPASTVAAWLPVAPPRMSTATRATAPCR